MINIQTNTNKRIRVNIEKKIYNDIKIIEKNEPNIILWTSADIKDIRNIIDNNIWWGIRGY